MRSKTTLPDSTNVLFNFFKNITIPEERKIRYDWESVYACKKAVNENSAEKYKNSVENEIKQHGKKSQYIQTQYYCSFIVKGERFIMKEDLEDNGVFGTDYEENINHYRKNKLFRVGGYDPATSDDNAALSLGLTQQVDDNNFAVILKGCKILNKEERKYSSEELAKQVALECKINQIDMLMIDATNAQEDRAYMVYKELKNIGCNTLVVPYSYANTNKQKMVQHVEDMIFAGQLKIPYEYYQDEYPDYKEFLDELFYLQRKISSTGTITYKAPDGSSFHDD